MFTGLAYAQEDDIVDEAEVSSEDEPVDDGTGDAAETVSYEYKTHNKLI